jgi:hypothetical protein
MGITYFFPLILLFLNRRFFLVYHFVGLWFDGPEFWSSRYRIGSYFKPVFCFFPVFRKISWQICPHCFPLSALCQAIIPLWLAIEKTRVVDWISKSPEEFLAGSGSTVGHR